MTPRATPFEQHRPRLTRLAHKMLGSAADAEDVVQDAYLRFAQADASALRSAEAWLVTVVTRLCLDRLRAVQVERRAYSGPWLPEPWMRGEHAVEPPDSPGERREALSYAALVLLERLSPEERAAFLLRVIFGEDYGVVAAALEKTEAACRQLVHRAEERLAEGRARREATASERLDLLRRFQAAASAEDTAALTALLRPGATYTADGGGKTFAAPYVLQGVARVLRIVIGVARKVALDGGVREVLALLDGEPAVITYRNGQPYSLTFLDVVEGRIAAVYKVLNPEKLRDVPAPTGA